MHFYSIPSLSFTTFHEPTTGTKLKSTANGRSDDPFKKNRWLVESMSKIFANAVFYETTDADFNVKIFKVLDKVTMYVRAFQCRTIFVLELGNLLLKL